MAWAATKGVLDVVHVMRTRPNASKNARLKSTERLTVRFISHLYVDRYRDRSGLRLHAGVSEGMGNMAAVQSGTGIQIRQPFNWTSVHQPELYRLGDVHFDSLA